MSALSSIAPHLQRFWRWLLTLPLRPLWLLVLWMALLLPRLQKGEKKPGEFYPFSNLPMYSSFAPSTYYVYVTDPEGAPVAVKYLSGKVLSNVKKIYDTGLKEQKERAGGKIKIADLPDPARREAGDATLQWLAGVTPPERLTELGGLRLVQVDITYGEDGIQKDEREVGSFTAGGAS